MKALRFVVPLLIVCTLLFGLLAKTPQPGFARANAAVAASNPVGGPPGVSWTMTFNDEFDGTSLNRTAWRSDYFPNGGNGEMQQYVSDNSHNNYVVQNGALSIIGRKETLNGQPYTSGIIHTKGLFEQKYGYFEIRAKVPYGKGFWPAFWLLPDQDNWVPEIDVTEILDDKPNITYMTYHYYNSTGAYVQTQSQFTGPDFSAGYHTFAVDWEPNAMVWYVDGVEQKRVTDASIIPTMQLYVIANLAIGGNWPGAPDSSTVFPSSFDIDYIRVWQKSAAAPTATATRPPATAVPTATKPPATAVPTATRPPATATPLPTVSGNMIANPSFESTSSWYASWGLRNDLGATFSQDTTTSVSRASLKTVMPTSNSSQPWLVGVNQSGLSLTKGRAYTISFWAKATTARPIRVIVQGQNSPYTEYTHQTANLTTGWKKFSITFTAPASNSATMLNFNLADATGTVWLDEVYMGRSTRANSGAAVFLPSVLSGG